MAVGVTERQGELMRTGIYVLVVAAYGAVLLWVAAPGLRERWARGQQWARYYGWRARWLTLEPWEREAAIVRGRGPAE